MRLSAAIVITVILIVLAWAWPAKIDDRNNADVQARQLTWTNFGLAIVALWLVFAFSQ